jgi:hypothetical protein
VAALRPAGLLLGAPELLWDSVTAVLWQAADGGSEVCVLERLADGWRLRGTVLTHHAGQPIEIRYAVTADAAWATSGVDVSVAPADGDTQQLDGLRALWSGTKPPEFRDCIDVDLSFTPATNTLPIRRLGLEVGEEAEIRVAWLVWPELGVEPALQRYTRLGVDRYRYAQEAFEAELTVDEHGLVLEYEGLWRAIASTSPDAVLAGPDGVRRSGGPPRTSDSP